MCVFGWGYTTAFYLISLYLLVIIVTQKYKKYCKRRKKIAKKWSAAAWSKSKGTWLRVPLAKKTGLSFGIIRGDGDPQVSL